MVKKIAKKLVRGVERLTNWNIVLMPNTTTVRPTAVKSDIGFWYCGNITDENDISYGVLRNGVVESYETTFVLKILELLRTNLPHQTFYDIGANSGYYGIMAAFTGKGTTTTHSFEPLTEYAELIRQSVFLNRLENTLTVHNYAIGSTVSTHTMQVIGSGSSLVPGFLGKQDHLPTREISVKPLDLVIREEGLSLPEFIKIDVEGFEYEVLKGAEATIKNAKPILFIEIVDLLKTGYGDYKNDQVSHIFDLLHGLGYDAFIVRDSILPVTTTVTEPGAFMYLFLHKQNVLHDKIKAII